MVRKWPVLSMDCTLHVLLVCFFTLFIVYVHVHMSQNVCRGQKITFESWFFPSTEWVLGTELRP